MQSKNATSGLFCSAGSVSPASQSLRRAQNQATRLIEDHPANAEQLVPLKIEG